MKQLLFLILLATAAFAQHMVSGTITSSPPTGDIGRQNYTAIGIDDYSYLKYNLETKHHLQYAWETKDYLNGDLKGKSIRYTGELRYVFKRFATVDVFAIPIAANLRQVHYRDNEFGDAGYKKNGQNIGVGAGIRKRIGKSWMDFSSTYYFPDFYKWHTDANGKRLGNQNKGWSFASNGYFRYGKWVYGHQVSLSRWSAIQPYDAEPRPTYTSLNGTIGFRFGRVFGN